MKPAARLIFSLLLAATLFGSCTPSPVYQRQEGVPGTRWASAYEPSFVFVITDTQAVYNMYFLIRHTSAYPFSNVWLQFSIQGPNDTEANSQRIEIPLAQDNGNWYGRGMNGIWEQRMPIATARGVNIQFPAKGNYTVRFAHLMRTDPLPEVMNVGLRIEKTGWLKKPVANPPATDTAARPAS